MAQVKDGRTHRGMYMNNRLWLLAWFGGKMSKRTRPDYIAFSLREQLKREGILDEYDQLPARHKKRLRAMLMDNPPDSRNVVDMLKALDSKEVM